MQSAVIAAVASTSRRPVAHLAGRAVSRRGPRVVGSAAIGITAAGLAFASFYAEAAPLMIIGVGIAAAGLGAGFVTGTTTALGEADHAHAGVVSGIVNTSHEFGGAIGVSALSGAIAAGAGNAAGADLGVPLAAMAVIAAVLTLVSALAIPRGRSSHGGARLMH